MTNQDKTSRFQPGLWLWLFTGFFLPLFLFLGVWQLNRADEKEQLLAIADQEPALFEAIDWSATPTNRRSEVSGHFLQSPLFLIDNKTYQGQFGYEAFALLETESGTLAASLGWVAGSQDRSILPTIQLPDSLTNASITLRDAPENALFNTDANTKHPADQSIWIAQSLTLPWLNAQTGKTVLGFAQLNNTKVLGLGPVIWQPSVMTPLRHKAYAWQWFAMAFALLGMFLYAGFRSHPTIKLEK